MVARYSQEPCDFCGTPINIDLRECIHCGRSRHFPNVRLADTEVERGARATRVEAARARAATRGCEAEVDLLEASAQKGAAVLCRSLIATLKLAESSHELFATYFQLTRAKARLPSGDEWDPIRAKAHVALFGAYGDEVHCAALSADGRGVDRFGEVRWTLSDDMIAHRASVYHANSAWESARQGARFPEPGFRAPWSQRGEIAVAKHADEMQTGDGSSEAAARLLQTAARPEDDVYIEVHIGGPMSIQTMSRIDLGPECDARLADLLREMLAPYGVLLGVGPIDLPAAPKSAR